LKTAAIIPVKRPASAHERLAPTLPQPARQQLAEALFFDLLAKLRRSRTIDELIVVTADAAIGRHARWLGCEVVHREEDDGHSEAAAAGARAARARGIDRVAMLPTDCPLLDPADLDAHLGRSPRSALIVPDRRGTGTNALVLNPPDAFAPAFGPDSCARHISRARAAGVGFSLERIESLEIDLDTPEDLNDLRDALLLDPGPAHRTAKVLWELGSQATEATPA
jgi:2-phospho-L-lactate guanylyltransferase